MSKITQNLVMFFAVGTLGIIIVSQGKFNAANNNIRSFMVAENEVMLIQATYPADYSDDSILVGASHNIFVGRVIQKISNKERGMGPETQFEVEVIDNIKGNLNGSVVVNQQGGYLDGKLYVMEGDLFTEGSDEESLLQPGSTYLLTTRYNEKENWYTVFSYPNANAIVTSREEDINKLKAIAQDNSRAKQLKEAYPDEILLRADVINNKTHNKFSTRNEKETEMENIELSTSTLESASSTNEEIIATTTVEEVLPENTEIELFQEGLYENEVKTEEENNFIFPSDTVE